MRFAAFVSGAVAIVLGAAGILFVWFRLTSTSAASPLGGTEVGIGVAIASAAWGVLFFIYWPTRPKRVRGSEPPSIASIDDVVKWGWSGPRLLDELIRIDYETIDGLTANHEGHRQQWSPVFMDHPDTWRLLIEGPGNIVGYWHFVPLFDEDYRLAMAGKLLDSSITTDRVKLFEIPGTYKIYFVSICVEARLRHTSTVRLLFQSLYDSITELAKNGVFIEEVCANAYTPSGIAVCKSFGMEFVKDHVDHGQVWARRIYPFKSGDPLLRYGGVASLYAAHFQTISSRSLSTHKGGPEVPVEAEATPPGPYSGGEGH